VPIDYPWTHLRADWENPAEPVKGPAPFPWETVDHIAIHYTAALNLIDGDPGENWAGIPAYLRAIQHDYLTNPLRGYSIGYGVAVDQRGDTWQLRGVDWRNAANLNWNHRTFTILCLVDAADELRPPAVDAVRSLVAWFRSQSPFGDASGAQPNCRTAISFKTTLPAGKRKNEPPHFAISPGRVSSNVLPLIRSISKRSKYECVT
jgi:hypothetical protein